MDNQHNNVLAISRPVLPPLKKTISKYALVIFAACWQGVDQYQWRISWLGARPSDITLSKMLFLNKMLKIQILQDVNSGIRVHQSGTQCKRLVLIYVTPMMNSFNLADVFILNLLYKVIDWKKGEPAIPALPQVTKPTCHHLCISPINTLHLIRLIRTNAEI